MASSASGFTPLQLDSPPPARGVTEAAAAANTPPPPPRRSSSSDVASLWSSPPPPLAADGSTRAAEPGAPAAPAAPHGARGWARLVRRALASPFTNAATLRDAPSELWTCFWLEAIIALNYFTLSLILTEYLTLEFGCARAHARFRFASVNENPPSLAG
jgi:hypothetical protein